MSCSIVVLVKDFSFCEPHGCMINSAKLVDYISAFLCAIEDERYTFFLFTNLVYSPQTLYQAAAGKKMDQGKLAGTITIHIHLKFSY